MSKGQFQRGSHFGRRTLERCSTKGKTKKVSYIDVETGKSHEVIIIDAPESSEKKLLGPSVSQKKLPTGKVISIDDDEISASETENADGGGNHQDSGATSSKASCPSVSQSSEEANVDECQLNRKRKIPMKFSKSKRTYSEKTFSRNYFGWGPLCDSTSSDSDSSDCEIIEGSCGKISEQWDRAALKKRTFEGIPIGQPGLDDEASGSGSFADVPKHVEVENSAEQHVRDPFSYTYNNTNNDNVNLSTSRGCDDNIREDSFLSPEENVVGDSGKAVEPDSPSWCRTPVREEAHFFPKKVDIQESGKTFRGEPSFCDAEVQSDTDDSDDELYSLPKEKEFSEKPQVRFEKDWFWEEEENAPAEPTPVARDETHFNEKAGLAEEVFLQGDKRSNETHVSYDRATSPGLNEMIHREPCLSTIQSPKDKIYEGAQFNYEEKSFLGEPSLRSNQPCGETWVNEVDRSVWWAYFPPDDQIQRESEVINGNVSHQDNVKTASENLSPDSSRIETQVNHQTGRFTDEKEQVLESVNNTEQVVERSPLLHAPDGNGPLDYENNIIGKREKLKETDEFKRAAEEEWASRQRQLQIQAEEAQRLRKRKKAETQRLLDMERRQKERIEEMRETQKKNVETINLKDQLRAEVRKELHRMELVYTDMVSLLRALGIRVGTGFCPSSREVNAAYKQALLKFHPDRASRTDVRQQVEAEEKFKLVSRLKEKLLPVS